MREIRTDVIFNNVMIVIRWDNKKTAGGILKKLIEINVVDSLYGIVTPLLAWYDKNARVLPWRENNDPYRVWVSEIMLQQTQVETVIPYYIRFMQQIPDIRTLAELGQEQLFKLWEGLGYLQPRRNLQKAAQIIMEKYAGRFPKLTATYFPCRA
jgi:A/G-specific adenine glycosylase